MRTSAFSAMTPKAQMAIQVRASEKQILSDALKFWLNYEKQLVELSKQSTEKQPKEEL